jgi:hypothetical protein
MGSAPPKASAKAQSTASRTWIFRSSPQKSWKAGNGGNTWKNNIKLTGNTLPSWTWILEKKKDRRLNPKAT